MNEHVMRYVIERLEPVEPRRRYERRTETTMQMVHRDWSRWWMEVGGDYFGPRLLARELAAIGVVIVRRSEVGLVLVNRKLREK